jgi:hypothetical protein
MLFNERLEFFQADGDLLALLVEKVRHCAPFDP